ncbi:sensor domain-containing diguanylate cyclase [Budvicia aquatica]|uniref:diguanylate cyclase n=1 Tax=Budvicia aquatica TaxID=82979 RepID=A0A2C6DHG3_9GAMM|nr:sensor domain-containing diguanylate cyclase [Budvicia aquatica]PHI29728.1 sensor domain-containing diguanylate cyclase [Budvicia aquatica]VFS48120.1 Bacteriophytochrome cph2 [Budvicia aquatica]
MQESKVNINRIHSLYESLVKRHTSLDSTFHTILNEGMKAFNLSLGIISQIDGDSYALLAVSPEGKDLSAGQVFELKNTYCHRVVSEKKIISIEHAGSDPDFNTHPVYIGMKLESYISAPIWIREKVWGTLNFSSTQIKEVSFSKDDHEFISLMADGIGSLIEMNLLSVEKEDVISALSKNNDILESIFENSTIGMALVSPSGQWVKVNNSLTHMLGYTEDYLLSINFQNITHPDDLTLDLQQLDSLAQGNIPFYQLEKRYLTASENYIWILLSVSLVREDNGDVKYYIAQIQSIDERKKMEMELKNQKEALHEANIILERMATEDTLTEIANRRKFMLWFESEMTRLERHPVPISVALADIDFFKSYNDDYGHQEGDFALKSIAKKLSHTLRGQDKIARFGGEEFILLFPETDEKGCLLVCEKLRKSVESLSTLKRTVTISIGGVTYYPKEGVIVHFDDLLKVADSKLYEAKRSGRNQVKVVNLAVYQD